MTTGIQLKAELVVTSEEHSLAVLLAALPIEPLQTWNRGDNIQNTKLVRHHSGAVLSSTTGGLDVELLVCDVLDNVSGHSEAICEAARRLSLDIGVACVSYVRDQAPIVNISQSTVSRLHEMNAAFDLDIIFLPVEQARAI